MDWTSVITGGVIVAVIEALVKIFETIWGKKHETIKTIADKVTALQSDVKDLKQSNRDTLYFQIKSTCEQCYKDGYVEKAVLEATEEAWKTYHDKLGGNGYLTTMMAKVRELNIL